MNPTPGVKFPCRGIRRGGGSTPVDLLVEFRISLVIDLVNLVVAGEIISGDGPDGMAWTG